jgi:hypothetical protein
MLIRIRAQHHGTSRMTRKSPIAAVIARARRFPIRSCSAKLYRIAAILYQSGVQAATRSAKTE